eukprot:PhM_4_TR4024/c0_g2_i1/m.47057
MPPKRTVSKRSRSRSAADGREEDAEDVPVSQTTALKKTPSAKGKKSVAASVAAASQQEDTQPPTTTTTEYNLPAPVVHSTKPMTAKLLPGGGEVELKATSSNSWVGSDTVSTGDDSRVYLSVNVFAMSTA